MVGDSVNLPRRIGAVVLRYDHLHLVRYVSGGPASQSVSFFTVSCKENQDRVVEVFGIVRINADDESEQ